MQSNNGKLPYGWPHPPRIPQSHQDRVRDLCQILIVLFVFGCLALSIYLFVTQ